ncbi:glycosyltransferase family 4 protein [Qipengyuania gaetbuli]|uniref:glycosyltransferase family 4 protein n=1 Tax=Qipengyuania gaetbuli TaxID=266952 RepID=UPI001C99119C|nr:glycosyltransferase family 1 protein [Qipengyuania gaetbuli]MBY6013493.1 glycosyltransferase family 4 protein [Qipengyuania gaetbuli]
MIYLNARFTGQSLTGVQRVAYELGRRLVERRNDVKAVAPVQPDADYAIPVQIAPAAAPQAGGHFWEQVTLPRMIGKRDLLVGLGATGPVSLERQIVMIHDVNYLLGADGYSWKFRTWYRFLHRFLTARASICTVSHWSAKEIAKAYSIPVEQITVIHNAADHLDDVTSKPGTLAHFGINARPYALCVGSSNPNKNFQTALAAYQSLENPGFDLVIVGAGNARIFRDETGGQGAHPSIHRLPRMDDSELKAVFEGAGVFLMPSILEGFGLPALEAMKLGVPVVSSNAASLPEVCGDAALYCDPLDVSGMASALERVMGDHCFAEELSAKGGSRAASFSWDASAAKLNALIDRRLSEG